MTLLRVIRWYTRLAWFRCHLFNENPHQTEPFEFFSVFKKFMVNAVLSPFLSHHWPNPTGLGQRLWFVVLVAGGGGARGLVVCACARASCAWIACRGEETFAFVDVVLWEGEARAVTARMSNLDILGVIPHIGIISGQLEEVLERQRASGQGRQPAQVQGIQGAHQG